MSLGLLVSCLGCIGGAICCISRNLQVRISLPRNFFLYYYCISSSDAVSFIKLTDSIFSAQPTVEYSQSLWEELTSGFKHQSQP